MSTKIYLHFIISLLISTNLFSQKSHCRKLNINTPEPDTFAIIDKSPYRQNTRANLIFFKRNIDHLGCNENPYQTIVNENFEEGFDSTLWLKEYPYPPPFNKIHSSLNDTYIHTNQSVNIENGILKLHVTNDNPSYTYIDESGVEQTKCHPYSLGVLHSKNPLAGGEWKIEASGCYKYGKFSARIKFPKSNDINSALWFYGAGNEIDAYELFHGTDGKIRSSIHQWNVITDSNNTHAEYGLNAHLGNLSEKYNVWEIEWTPYKIVWSLNGNPFRIFYKYYRKSVENLDDKKNICFIGMDCHEIPSGSTTIYELSGWHSFSTRPIDLIIGMGITGTPQNDEVVEVDWIKIEQRPNLQLISTTNFPCKNQTFQVSALHTDQTVNWTTSDNLEIIDSFENTITVLAHQDSSRGWVEATVLGNNINLPNGNWSTIGYTFNDEFSEEAQEFHNFSYNCTNAKMSVKKEIIVGIPISPELESYIKPCLKNGGFEIILKNKLQYDPDIEFEWSSISDALLFDNHDSLWVIPDTTLEDSFFDYTLSITNDCGTSIFPKKEFIPKCKNDAVPPILRIFPNPVHHTLSFHLEKTNYEIISTNVSPYKIIQTGTGKVIHQGLLGEDFHVLNVSGWGQGLYKIGYQIKGKSYSTSFIIAH